MATRVGVIFRPDFRPDGLCGVAQAADAAGVDELWLWEAMFPGRRASPSGTGYRAGCTRREQRSRHR